VKLIIGLGNAGLAYRNTRHNIGFRVVDNFIKANRPKIAKDIVLLKPDQFMNNSGAAVKKAVKKWNADLKDVLIICDDANLELGVIRFRAAGSAGGHKGLGSIIAALGTENFNRLRIGIGADKSAVLRDYVLSRFTASEKRLLGEVIDKAAEAVGVWIQEGIETAMNKYNTKNIKERGDKN
jgi:PTH1 family peptidyl-tRNA hydrolase